MPFIIYPMTKVPSLAQLLKQAIENRLLDMHTALIARVESYDAAKQQVNVSPVLKRAIKSVTHEVILEQLPVLSDVPVLFPRAGGFFISFPIQPGDFVQIVFNEVSIEEWISTAATSVESIERFSLQGAVAIPGVFPDSNPLSGAHEKNFVAGKDNGVQLHIDSEKICLGSADASEALAIASKVMEEFEKIRSAFNSHTHTGSSVSGGAVTTIATKSILGPSADLGTKKVVAE